MGRRSADMAFAYRGSSAGSAMLSREPAVVLVSKPALRALIALFAVYFSIRAYASASLASSPTANRFPTCRVRLRLLSPSCPTNVPCDDTWNCTCSYRFSLGLLRNGCPVVKASNVRCDGSEPSPCGYAFPDQTGRKSWVVWELHSSARCDEDVEWANGYYFESTAGDIEGGWVLEAQNSSEQHRALTDDTSSWLVVGASVERHILAGKVQLFPNIRPFFTTISPPEVSPSGSSTTRVWVRRDLRPSNAWVAMNVGLFCWNIIAISSLLIAGCLSRTSSIRLCVQAGYLGAAVWMAIAAAVCEPWQWREACVLTFRSALRIFTAIGLFCGRRMITSLPIIATVELAVAVAADAALYGPSHAGVVQALTTAGTLGQLIFGLVMLALRSRAVARALHLVTADRARYDAAWVSICAGANAARGLQEVQIAAEALIGGSATSRIGLAASAAKWTRNSVLRRMSETLACRNKPHAASAIPGCDNSTTGQWDRPGCSGVAVIAEPWQRASCVDQILIQARFLQPILRDKVRIWAATSGGLFSISGGGFAPCPVSSTGRTEGIRWASVKSPERVIEKLCRIYRKDASRLVDVCRESIIYETPHALASGLRAVAADPEVTVVRVKNRLNWCRGAAESTGYRDVVFNLRIESPLTSFLGISGHVCEVQFILKAIAVLKSDTGHANYVLIRNLLGE